jgi:hypothetical protein
MSASQASSTISRVINKTKRRRRGKDSATNSIISNESDDIEGRRGLRDSLDSAIDKVKTLKPDEDHPRREKLLSSLIPDRKKNDAQIEDNRLSMDQASDRGRSISEKGTIENDLSALDKSDSPDDRRAERNPSNGSLITVDSDVEA